MPRTEGFPLRCAGARRALHARMRWIRRGLLAALVLASIPVLAFEALYHYALTKVPVLPDPPPAEGTPFIRDAVWVIEGGDSNEVAVLWAWNFWDGFPPSGEGNRYPMSAAARTYVLTHVDHHGKLVWQFQWGATEVWLSRHATADDLKRELAAWTYFGRGARGIEAGAHAWFGKCAGQLRIRGDRVSGWRAAVPQPNGKSGKLGSTPALRDAAIRREGARD